MADGPETKEPHPSTPASRAPKASKAWLLGLPVAALVVAFGLWTVTKGEPSENRGDGRAVTSTSADPSLASIAVQQGDLPEGSIKCSFSGDVETYLQRLKDAKSQTHAEVLNTWKRLQDVGATAAYIAVWGDTQPACDNVISSEGGMDHTPGSRVQTTVASFVVRYRSVERAEAAYRADIFEQSTFNGRRNYDVGAGAETGLGPNSAVALTPGATIPLHDAVWQNGSVTVFFTSVNLPLDRSKQATSSINRRILGPNG